jgi:hypothetical protein
VIIKLFGPAVNSDKKLLFCNVDFDTDLASVRSPRQQQSCLDARFYFFVCGGADDRILLDVIPHPDYEPYLSGFGIAAPQDYLKGETLSDYTAFPWGWSTSAVERFHACGAKVHHPPLKSVRMVNSRRFCHRTAERHGLGISGSKLCESAGEARASIRASRTFPLVLKPEHGNAGIGLIQVSSADRADDERIETLFSRPGMAAVIEPWVNRLADISSRFRLDGAGMVGPVTHHRTLNNRAGVYYGNLLEPENPLVAKWKDRLDAGAAAVAQELHAAGYFGPSGLDWIVYSDDGTGKETCALVDINARQPMSFVAYSLRDRLAANKHCLLLFAPRRHYPALGDYGSWARGCGENAFAPERGTGILLFTPLSYTAGGVEYRPLRHGFFIAGNTREELGAYESHLRNAFKGPRS